MNNRFVIIIVSVIAIFLGVVFFAKQGDDKSSNSSVTASEHVQGEGTSGVILVEYGDFQCPACGAYYPIVKQVKEKYGDQIKFQFRNFPIVSIHPNAMSAHRAAEAAAMQGKFWEMHDLLYESQDSWVESKNPAAIFKAYAEQIGLDVDKYSQDLVKSEVASIIQKDIQAGTDLQVKATPGFVLDGKLLSENPRSLDDFVKLIDEAIANKQN